MYNLFLLRWQVFVFCMLFWPKSSLTKAANNVTTPKEAWFLIWRGLCLNRWQCLCASKCFLFSGTQLIRSGGSSQATRERREQSYLQRGSWQRWNRVHVQAKLHNFTRIICKYNAKAFSKCKCLTVTSCLLRISFKIVCGEPQIMTSESQMINWNADTKRRSEISD